MKRPHPDRHFYDCPTDSCRGQMGVIGHDLQKRVVYQCPKCERRCGESALEREHRLRRLQD